MIRRARLEDVEPIVDALLRMKGQSEFRTVKVEFDRARKAIRQCISSPQGFAAVADREGKITGVLLGVCSNYWYSASRFASDLAFSSRHRGDGQKLMQMFVDWSNSKNAQLLMAQSSGRRPEALAKFYAQWRLVPVGHLFVGERPIAVSPALRSVK